MYGYNTFHENLMKTLINSVRAGSASHAYIFEGDAGLNLLESAKLFAMALTCKNKATAPCTECSCCREANAMTNPDIIYFEKPKDKKTIGVDAIRELTDDTAIKPFASERKVYIIRDGDLLTEAAQNALLKTLEEPSEYIVFIIITTNENLLLQTVKSRSTLIHFPPVSEKIVEEYIEEKYSEAENKEFLIKYSEGIPGRIDEIMEDEGFYVMRNEALSNLPYLLTKNKLCAFTIRKYLESEKDNVEKILDFWVSYLRDILIIGMGERNRIINKDKTEDLINLSKKLEPKILTEAMDEIFKAKKMLQRNVSLKSVALSLPLKINNH